MRSFPKKIFFLLAGIFFVLFAGKIPLWAADYGGLGIFPANPDPNNPLTESWFIYNLVPGEEKKDTAIIRNTSEKTLSAKIYAVDGTTTADGSFTLEAEKKKKEGIGQWVSLPLEVVTLGPGEEKRIDFTIKIPENAPVGDHTGGIILENLETKKEKGINLVTRVGVRIYETVPGQLLRKLKITEFTWKLVEDKVVFYFGLENGGNTVLNPSGKLFFENSFGGQGEFSLHLGTVLPGRPTRVPVTWAKTPLLGQIKAKAVVRYGEKEEEKLEREIAFFYLTKKFKMILVALFLIFVFLSVFMAAKRKTKEKR